MAKRKKQTHKSNPELLVLTNPLAKAALKAFERFHWREPVEAVRIKTPKGVNAKHLVKIGEVDEIRYTTDDYSERSKISDRWKHKFKDKPSLCTTPDGDVLIIFGGKLEVTPRGVEG